jgi:deoxyhypusine synthase
MLKDNLQRNGADFSVYIVSDRILYQLPVYRLSIHQNTGQEFDGSDSGARPDEAISWGKIRAGSESVKVKCGTLQYGPLAYDICL